ncbi:MAG: glycosyltransferase family 39 protein [Verrucomicrobiales bacterium]|jgi:predicted membrane-bound mannosyltransferase|nr:glycosyltransferase family 39 protein [Verrucomicrobiales bacterium]
MPARVLLLPVIFLAALLLRLPGLDSRPFHVDEANNAFILEEALQQGGFHYRPSEHHGPTLFYLAELPCKILGIQSAAEMEAWALRVVPVICGALAAASVLLLAPYLSNFAALTAALIVTVGAMFHYYSRTFIHESLLLLFTVWFLASLFRWRGRGTLRWALASGLLAGLMVATKENAAVSVILIGAPFLLPLGKDSKIRMPQLLAAGILSLAVILLLIGPDNLWQAIALHTRRGLDSGHNWPWYQFLVWFGSWRGLGLAWDFWLAVPLAVVALYGHRRSAPVLILALGFTGLFLFHCLLPYKTPWLMLEPMLLLSLLAAAGLNFLLAKRPAVLKALTVALLLALLCSETWQRSFHNQVRVDNPLAYSPTDPQTADLVRQVDAIANALPDKQQAVVQVIGYDYWPLPWLLRKYPNKGFWQEPPEQWPGEILLCGPETIGWIPNAREWQFTPYYLRPGVLIFVGSKLNRTGREQR